MSVNATEYRRRPRVPRYRGTCLSSSPKVAVPAVPGKVRKAQVRRIPEWKQCGDCAAGRGGQSRDQLATGETSRWTR